ncbi:MAG: hypothetical protein K6D59_10770 [Bacteroidales bacterium]|nr:hypothetical protein [Bacteroidales bacterium]
MTVAEAVKSRFITLGVSGGGGVCDTVEVEMHETYKRLVNTIAKNDLLMLFIIQKIISDKETIFLLI